MARGPCEKTRVRLDRPHLRFTGRLRERLCGGGARRGVNDELGDHRIIIGRYVISFLDPAVDADALRKAMALERPCRRKEAARRIFRLEARFQCPTMNAPSVLLQCKHPPP